MKTGQVRGDSDFKEADASLHRFSDGSYKQQKYSEGNLQTSYRRNPDGTVSVDADIDLYREPVLHFFGEVPVNHLSGRKTDPFCVYRVLKNQDVSFVGGFRIFSLAA